MAQQNLQRLFFLIPAEAGIQDQRALLDPGFRDL